LTRFVPASSWPLRQVCFFAFIADMPMPASTFCLTVNGRRCDGRTHRLTLQIWSGCIPDLSLMPLSSRQTLCAGKVLPLIQNAPYPSEVHPAVHSQHAPNSGAAVGIGPLVSTFAKNLS
jgi:hypothetical protein